MKVLIADDQPAVCAALQLLFELHGLPSRGRQPPRGGAGPDRDRGHRRRRAGHELHAGEDLRRGRRRAVPRDQEAGPRSAGRAADRVELAGDRGVAGQGRRQRLHGQAVGRRQAGPRRQEPGADARAAAGEHAPATPSARACARRWPAATTCAAWSTPARRCTSLVQPGVHDRGLRRARADHRARTARARRSWPRSSRPTRGARTGRS